METLEQLAVGFLSALCVAAILLITFVLSHRLDRQLQNGKSTKAKQLIVRIPIAVIAAGAILLLVRTESVLDSDVASNSFVISTVTLSAIVVGYMIRSGKW